MARHYSKTITISLTTAEKDRIKAAAEAEGVSMSEFVRRAIQAYIDAAR